MIFIIEKTKKNKFKTDVFSVFLKLVAALETLAINMKKSFTKKVEINLSKISLANLFREAFNADGIKKSAYGLRKLVVIHAAECGPYHYANQNTLQLNRR
ncbi:hypothetical protein [Candidatus Bartonella washoeensis]|uniref:hypothetical protein n=1 Tax=Candidatus Bartonella washoeensis TaxID=186739 RepID=UPI0006870668|nr:hypothetical protein [Bartonella washoeensis]